MCSVFACERCGQADSIHATQTSSDGYICHRCKHGEWHGQFPETQYSFEEHGPALNRTNPESDDTISFS